MSARQGAPPHRVEGLHGAMGRVGQVAALAGLTRRVATRRLEPLQGLRAADAGAEQVRQPSPLPMLEVRPAAELAEERTQLLGFNVGDQSLALELPVDQVLSRHSRTAENLVERVGAAAAADRLCEEAAGRGRVGQGGRLAPERNGPMPHAGKTG
jgi:hypothetical protein